MLRASTKQMPQLWKILHVLRTGVHHILHNLLWWTDLMLIPVLAHQDAIKELVQQAQAGKSAGSGSPEAEVLQDIIYHWALAEAYVHHTQMQTYMRCVSLSCVGFVQSLEAFTRFAAACMQIFSRTSCVRNSQAVVLHSLTRAWNHLCAQPVLPPQMGSCATGDAPLAICHLHLLIILSCIWLCRTALGRSSGPRPLAAGDDGMLLSSRVQLLDGSAYEGPHSPCCLLHQAKGAWARAV